MDKAKYKKMYEIADRLSKVDTANLNEQQLSEHTAMIEKLKQIAMEDNGFATFMQQLQTTGTDKPVQIVVYGKMPAHMRAEEVWDALMEILPNEYPSIQAAQQKTAEIARYNGAVVAERPKSEAEKIVKQFNAYGIKARINTSEGVAEGRYYPSPHDYDSDIDYYAAVDRYLGKKGPRPGDEDWEETAPGDGFGDEDDEKTNEADAPRPTYNVMKLGGALDIDPRMLRVAITRGLQGQATRTDMSVLARSFLNMISNSDDKDIQYIANLIKTGNPRPMAQENTAAIAERNAFVNAMRNVKQGEKFSVGGKEYTKTTKHGEDSEVTENINKEAYDRLKRVFDFSNFKGDV